MNLLETKKILSIYDVFYPNSSNNMNEEQIEMRAIMWQKKLSKYNYAEMNIVADRLTTKNKFMPTIAEIIEEAELMRNEDLQLNALEEWDKVIDAIRRGKELSVLNGKTQEIARQIGWQRMNESTSEQLSWLKKDFIMMLDNKQMLDSEAYKLNEKSLTLAEIQRLAKLQADTSNLTYEEIKRLTQSQEELK